MDYDAMEIEVHKVETVTIESLMQEPGEPFWRVILDGICYDFDTSAEAWAFADEHRPAIADLRARNEALVADLNERGVLIVELLAMPKANIGFAGDIHIRRARRIIDGDNDAKAQGEANYRAYCAASHDHEHEGSIDGLELIVRMIETYAADALPANKHGQIHFARGMLESAAGEIKAFLANNALAANREG